MNKLLTLALLICVVPAWGAVYKWVDAGGKIHYSDQPPPDGATPQGTLRTPKPAAAPPVAADGEGGAAVSPIPKTAAEQDMEFRKRRLEAAEAETKRQQEAQAAEEKKRNCAQARNRLAAFEAGGRISKYGAGGEVIYLSDEEIAREAGEARKVAESWCK